MSDTKQYIIDSMSSLMRVGRYVGLSVNEEKTKYIYTTRNVRNDEDESDLEVNGIPFPQVPTGF